MGICFITGMLHSPLVIVMLRGTSGAAMGVMGPATPLPISQEGEMLYLHSFELVAKVDYPSDHKRAMY